MQGFDDLLLMSELYQPVNAKIPAGIQDGCLMLCCSMCADNIYQYYS